MSWMRLLDQEQAGGFERLEKAAGEPDAHAIAFPRLRRGDRRETQQLGFAQRLAVELA